MLPVTVQDVYCISAFLREQDKSSDIEQQPPFSDRKISNIQPQNGGGGGQNQQNIKNKIAGKVKLWIITRYILYSASS